MNLCWACNVSENVYQAPFFFVPESLRLNAWSAWTPAKRLSATTDKSVVENMLSGKKEEVGEAKFLRLTGLCLLPLILHEQLGDRDLPFAKRALRCLNHQRLQGLERRWARVADTKGRYVPAF